MRFFTN